MLGTWIRMSVFSLVLVFAAGPASALSLFFVTATQNLSDIGVGGDLVVEVHVSGVTEPDTSGFLRGFDIPVVFDTSVLSIDSVDVAANTTPFGGILAIILDESVIGDTARAALVTSSLDVDDASLHALQSDSFLLATLTFGVLQVTETALDFGTSLLTDSDGLRPHDKTSLSLVPEPSTAILVTFGLGWLAGQRGRWRTKPAAEHGPKA